MAKPIVLVIGSTGTVGSAAVERLAQRDHVKVLAGTRNPERARDVLPASVQPVHIDVDDPESITSALDGVDRVLLLTGYSVEMLRQSKRVVDTAVASGVTHMVHIGASGNPTAEVAHWGWHRFVEAYIETSGLGYTHLQPESFMQNIHTFDFLQDSTLLDPIGNAPWSWVDGRDVGKLAAAALEDPSSFASQTWRLGYEAATFTEVAAHVQAHSGGIIHVQSLDPDILYEQSIQAGGDPAYMACVRDQFKLTAAGKLANVEQTFDRDVFAQATGGTPTTWAEFLARR